MRRIAHRLLLVLGAIALAIVFAPAIRSFADDEAPQAAPVMIQAAVALGGGVDVEQAGGPFRKLYKKELHFMRIMSDPTKQQFEKIAAAGEPALKEVIKKYAAGMRVVQFGNGDQGDPRADIATAIVKAVQATMPPEQAARYAKEIELRAAARRRVAVLNLIAAMDKTLVLTADQRTKLKKVLEDSWDNSWAEPTMLYNLGNYYPAMPDQKIAPLLGDAQKKVWNGVQKGIRFGFQMDDGQGEDVDDEAWPGDPPAKKPDAKGAATGEKPAKPAEKP
jgi:hypothetical protein